MSPIILFIYNRPSHTQQTLEALSQNTLAQNSELIIFADGPKENATKEQIEKIQETRKVAKSKQWCKSVEIRESEKNKGLAKSIIEGVTEIVNKYGTVIVLEDDIVTGKYFLEYMNTALEKYKNEKKVWHITGWRDPVKKADNNLSFFYPNMDCWGWATWSDRWQNFEKNPSKLKETFTPKMIHHMNMDGAEPGNWQQVEDNISGKINTWAIFWLATIYQNDGLCLSPTKSLVKNVGFDNTGVHCGINKYQTINDSIDYKIDNFPTELSINVKEYNKNRKFVINMRKKHITLRFLISKATFFIPKSTKEKIKKIIFR